MVETRKEKRLAVEKKKKGEERRPFFGEQLKEGVKGCTFFLVRGREHRECRKNIKGKMV